MQRLHTCSPILCSGGQQGLTWEVPAAMVVRKHM